MSAITFCAACDAYLVENGPTPCLACLVRNARADERAKVVAHLRASAAHMRERNESWPVPSTDAAVAATLELEAAAITRGDYRKGGA